MSVPNTFEEALEIQEQLCELFDNYILSEPGKREKEAKALFHLFVTKGEEAMHVFSDFLIGAERHDWCDAHNSLWQSYPTIHEGCGWANPLKPCKKGKRVLVVRNLNG